MKLSLNILIAALVLATAAHPANAADMSVPVFKAAAPAAFNWTGCYVGIQGGGGVMNDSFTSRNGFGALAGGQVGCNYQLNSSPIVIGIEGEGWWSGLSNDNRTNAFVFVTDTSTHNRWDADVGLRIGLAFIDRIMSYAKVGGIWGRYDYSVVSLGTLQGSATLPGLFIGGGIEYAFTTNFIGRVEYISSFVRGNVTYVCGPAPCVAGFTGTESATKQVVKVGVSYLFH